MKSLLALCGTLLLASGCDAVRPLERAGTTRTIEAAVFEGGYGIHWHQKVAAAYTAAHEADGLRVRLWGDPRVVEKVKPRILRDSPPDVLLMSELPVWLLIAAGKLLPFDDALQEPAPGSDRPWRELFVPGTLDTFRANGKIYGLPSAFGAWACWYDARLFREHGWTPPATWDEFIALCEKIRAAGIAPIAYQGKYPIYGWWTLISLIQRCGGLAAVNRINALEDGAFSHPDVVRAAGLLQDLATRHFQPGALAMTHTESQLQFVSNRAAMIFCGLWLHNEMRHSTPKQFEMRCFTVPAVQGGRGSPRLFNGSGWEFIHVTAAGKHPEEAFDFVRYMVSPANAPDMGSSIGVISPLRGGTPRDVMEPPLQSALDMIENAEGIFSIRHEMLLLEWRNQVMQPAMAALLRGEMTPEAFGRALDAGVREALQNPDLIVPGGVQYDPAAFGESA